jgi:hypothetical protein
MAEDINDYGRFENFYKEEPEKREREPAEMQPPVPRSNPFFVGVMGTEGGG